MECNTVVDEDTVVDKWINCNGDRSFKGNDRI